MTDCLIIGFSDGSLTEYVEMLKSMGTDSGAFKDLDLAIVYHDNRPHRALDILTHFYGENRDKDYRPFHNSDFLWPVVTYLGTYLSRRGFSFDYVNLFQQEKEKLKEKLLKNDILTIAITTTLYVSPHPIQEIISFIRRYNDTAKIIIGGPFIAGQPKLQSGLGMKGLFKSLGADLYVISSEGEQALVNLLTALKSGSDLSAVENIAYKDGDNYVITPSSTESSPLEENMVNYSLFRAEEIDQFVTTRTAKSCPFSCAFCGFPERAGKYTYMSVEAVERELNAIRDIGTISTVTFIDDTFNVPKTRFKELLRMMIRNKYPFKWNCLYRSDHGDEEAIELMGKAGCEGVFLGVESGSDAMLQKMNKTARRGDYMKAIPLFRQAGVSTYASLIIGFPGETFDTVEETIDLIEEVKPDYFRTQLWYCDPLTPIWNQREEYEIRGSAFNWSHKTMDVKTACDLIDRTFLRVEKSIWLPQFGFEQWSTFYLQRRGMTVDQINTFLKCFNAAIKERIANPDKQEADPVLIENLRRSSQFDRGLEPEPIEIYTGASYRRAEEFWVEECGTRSPASNLELVREEHRGAGEDLARAPIAVDDLVLKGFQEKFAADLPAAILAAFSVLLSRLSGKQETLIASELSSDELRCVAPLSLHPDWSSSFVRFVERTRHRVEQASEYQLFGFYVATNPTIMAQRQRLCPTLDVGYSYRKSEGPADGEKSVGIQAAVEAGLELVLKASESDGGLSLAFLYSRNSFEETTIERMGAYLTSILREAWKNEDSLLGEISIDGSKSSHFVAAGGEESDAFHF